MFGFIPILSLAFDILHTIPLLRSIYLTMVEKDMKIEILHWPPPEYRLEMGGGNTNIHAKFSVTIENNNRSTDEKFKGGEVHLKKSRFWFWKKTIVACRLQSDGFNELVVAHQTKTQAIPCEVKQSTLDVSHKKYSLVLRLYWYRGKPNPPFIEGKICGFIETPHRFYSHVPLKSKL